MNKKKYNSLINFYHFKVKYFKLNTFNKLLSLQMSLFK